VVVCTLFCRWFREWKASAGDGQALLDRIRNIKARASNVGHVSRELDSSPPLPGFSAGQDVSSHNNTTSAPQAVPASGDAPVGDAVTPSLNAPFPHGRDAAEQLRWNTRSGTVHPALLKTVAPSMTAAASKVLRAWGDTNPLLVQDVSSALLDMLKDEDAVRDAPHHQCGLPHFP